MLITDRLTIDGKPRKTTEGFLVTEVRVARTGIQHYTGREADPQNEHGMRDASSVAIYRDAAEVFSVDSMQSFSMVDITVDHPPEAVTADNWRRYSVGVTGEHIARDGEYIRIPMMLKDADAIRAVEAGKRELSVGYSTKLDWTKGVTPDGLHYDAKQTIIRANHISIVDAARGGPELRIGDRKMKTIVHDGISIEFADQAADAYNAVAAKLAKLTADAAAAASTSAAALAAKDSELAKRDALIDDLKTKIMDPATLDAAVRKRGDLIAKAKALHDADYTGKSELDIRKAVLAAKGIALDGKTEAYVEARFDALADAVPTDPLRAAISQTIGATPATITDLDGLRKAADKAYLDHVNSLKDAYKQPAGTPTH